MTEAAGSSPGGNDPLEERIDRPTPAGGVYLIVRYYGADGAPLPRTRARRATFTEYAADDSAIASTSGSA